MEQNIEGKHFSITDQKDVKTVIYQVNKTEKEFLNDSPKYTMDRLDFTEEFIGEKNKKTFYVDNPSPTGNQLVFFSFGKEKVVVNMGILEDDKVRISKKPIPMNFKTLYSENEMEYKNFKYTPNLKRPITIIDPETAEEIIPDIYIDSETDEIKGKCKLKPYKSYFAFELEENN